jgi:hypothetical protein
VSEGAYRSAFFDAVQTIIGYAREKDQRLLQLLFGIIGVPEDMPVDAIELREGFKRFAEDAFRRGPLRADDLVNVCQMIRFQQQHHSGLTQYDARTGVTWEWDGNLVCHVVVAALACEAATQLADQGLYEQCSGVRWAALRALREYEGPGNAEAVAERVDEQIAWIAGHVDVAAALDAFDAAMPIPERR